MVVRRYAGFKEQSAFLADGDSTPTPEFDIDMVSSTMDAPTDSQMTYEGSLSRGSRTHVPGAYATGGNVVHGTDIDTIGWFLKWALGSYVFTEDGGTVATDLHEFYATQNNALPYFSTFIGKDFFEHAFLNGIVNQLTLQVDEAGWAQLTVDIISGRDDSETLRTIAALNLPATSPMAFHNLGFSIATVDNSAKLRAMTLVIANGGANQFGAGSRFPRRAQVFERNVTGTAQVLYESSAHLQALWGGAGGPVAGGSTEKALEITLDAGSAGLLTAAIPSTVYGGVPTQPSGRGEITQTIAFKAYEATHTLADAATDVESEILITLDNDNDEYTPS